MKPSSLVSTLFFLIVGLCALADKAWGKTAGEVLAQFQGLQESGREAQLVEAAKKEGKIVLYGTTNIVVMQQLLDQFRKKYSFLQIDNYRATTNRVYTKIQAEARSGTYAVDVIEISPASAFKLKQDHLLESNIQWV